MDNMFNTEFSLEAMASDLSAAERFGDHLEQQGLTSAPANLKSSILARSRHMDVRILAGTGRLSKKAELFLYGLKVGFAVACSIAAVGAVPRLYAGHSVHGPQENPPVYMEFYEKIQEWNGIINDFSKSLMNLEVSFYD